MAALSGITAVRPGSTGTQLRIVQYGGNVSVGQPIYKAANGKYLAADSNASQLTATAEGIAATPGVDGSFGIMIAAGSVVLVGTTMSVGLSYYVGATAGTIVPEADLTTGDWVTRLGTASSTTQLDLSVGVTNVQRP